ncbi:MAG: hypothetical protein V2I34_09190 [Bacteroidales bacterium]|jgi:hypothetical protein|nr:hypothetical protein [Bacteroidales bacterium]
MNWSVLKNLLEKFYEGISTADEERKALEMLRRNDLPPEFYDDRMILEGLYGKSEIPEPSPDLGKRIMTAIDDSEKEKRIIGGKRRLYSMVAVAASLLVIISFWFVLADNNRVRDTYSDPQLAYNETVEILYYLSENLNTGRTQMEDLSMISDARTKLELLPESRNAVSKELKALRYIENSVKLLNMNSNEKSDEQN